jgi:hypothetical protein
MKTSVRCIPGALASLLLLSFALSAPALAGLGSLKDKVKKKAQEAAGVKPKDAPAKGTESGGDGDRPGSRYSKNVLEITAEILAGFEKGLNAEIAKRQEFVKARGKKKTPEQYQKCLMDFIQSAEGQKSNAAYRDAAATQDITKIQAAADALKAAMAAHCGPDPNDHSAEDAEKQKITAAGYTAAGLTEFQYSIIKERLAPFFENNGAKAPKDKDWKTPGDGGLQYTYSAVEVAALQARAEVLPKLLKQTL